MSSKVLCVDDEPAILQAIRRQCHGKLQVELAVGPEQGLAALDGRGPFAVVVADMRMPGMDGATFLSEVKRRAPDTVRIMLTGNAEQETAIEAVNKGSVFRFLSKPCPPEEFLRAVQEGIALHHATRAERELLETTLAGTIKVLGELLALTHPAAATATHLVRETAGALARAMALAQPWQVDVAGALCRLGELTLPADLAEQGTGATPAERELLGRVPEIGHRLLSQIPRLEDVARIVLYHEAPFEGAPAGTPVGRELPEGARILKVALEFARRVTAGRPRREALADLRARPGVFDPEVLAALGLLLARDEAEQAGQTLREVELCELLPGHVLAAPILAQDGRLLLREGYPVSAILIERIRNLARLHGIRTPIVIRDFPPNHLRPR